MRQLVLPIAALTSAILLSSAVQAAEPDPAARLVLAARDEAIALWPYLGDVADLSALGLALRDLAGPASVIPLAEMLVAPDRSRHARADAAVLFAVAKRSSEAAALIDSIAADPKVQPTAADFGEGEVICRLAVAAELLGDTARADDLQKRVARNSLRCPEATAEAAFEFGDRARARTLLGIYGWHGPIEPWLRLGGHLPPPEGLGTNPGFVAKYALALARKNDRSAKATAALAHRLLAPLLKADENAIWVGDGDLVAEALIAAGDRAAAAPLLETLTRLAVPSKPWWRARVADLFARLGQRDRARALLRNLEPVTDDFQTYVVVERTVNARLALGDGEEAIAAFGAAAWTGRDTAYETLVRLARWLRAHPTSVVSTSAALAEVERQLARRRPKRGGQGSP